MAKPLTRHRPSSGTLCRSLAIQPYLLMHTIIFETLSMAAFQVFLSHSIPDSHARCGVEDGEAARAPCPNSQTRAFVGVVYFGPVGA